MITITLAKNEETYYFSSIDETKNNSLKLFDREWHLLGEKILNQLVDNSCNTLEIKLS